MTLPAGSVGTQENPVLRLLVKPESTAGCPIKCFECLDVGDRKGFLT